MGFACCAVASALQCSRIDRKSTNPSTRKAVNKVVAKHGLVPKRQRMAGIRQQQVDLWAHMAASYEILQTLSKEINRNLPVRSTGAAAAASAATGPEPATRQPTTGSKRTFYDQDDDAESAESDVESTKSGDNGEL